MELKIGLEGDGRVIEIHGSLDLYGVQNATQSVRPLLEEAGVMIVVDLAGLEFVDSSGIGMLFHWKHRVEQNGGRFSLRNVSASLRKVLSLGRLNDADTDA